MLERLARTPVLTAIAGAATIAFSAVLVRLADVEPATAAVFRCLYALPVLALLARAEDRRLGPRPLRSRRLGLAAGVFFAADLILWHHAIEAVGAGLATVLGNLQVVVVGLLAWLLLGERPSSRLLVAVPVVLAGVVLLSGALGGDPYGEDPVLGVVLGAATSTAYAGYILVLRAGATDLRRPAGPLADATAVTAVVAAGAGVLLGELDLVPSWPAHGWLVALALTSQVLGWMLISVSLPRLPAALTALVLLLQPGVSLALAAALLGERPSPVQLVGAAIVLAGVLVAAARRQPAPREPAAPAPVPVAVEV